jgi:hypothetical protein
MRLKKIGKKHSLETRLKMSTARKGIKKPQSYCKKLSQRMLINNPAKQLDVRAKISFKKRERDLLRQYAL